MSDDYLTSKGIEAEFGISVAKLERWSSQRDGCGCPLLHGDPLHYEVRDGLKRYRRRDIEALIRQCDEAARMPIIKENGDEWLRTTVAARRWQFSLPSLVGWRKNGCPWLLQKRKPQTKEVLILQRRVGSAGSFCRRHYYLHKDLAEISLRRSEAGQSAGWATAMEIAADARYGYSAWLLGKWSGRRKSKRKRKLPRFQCLGDRYLSGRLAHKGVGQDARRVVEYSLDDLDRIVEARAKLTGDLDPAVWIAGGKAVEQYGFSKTSLSNWKNANCPALGRKLTSRSEETADKNSRRQKMDYFRRDELDEIRRKNRHNGHEEPHEDADGKWWPVNEAARRCSVSPSVFHTWLTKPCRFLGRKLNSKAIENHGPRVKNGRQRVVHDDDVRAIRKAKLGIVEKRAENTIVQIKHAFVEHLSATQVTTGELTTAMPIVEGNNPSGPEEQIAAPADTDYQNAKGNLIGRRELRGIKDGFVEFHLDPSGPPQGKHSRKSQPANDTAAKPILAGMKWGEAAERMEQLRRQGERFTSQSKLAEQLGCSPFTINKAIKKTPSLQNWAKTKETAAPKAQSINDAITDRTAQNRELLPVDEAAIREFIEEAEPEVKAWFLGLPTPTQLEVISDPDQYQKILGRHV